MYQARIKLTNEEADAAIDNCLRNCHVVKRPRYLFQSDEEEVKKLRKQRGIGGQDNSDVACDIKEMED